MGKIFFYLSLLLTGELSQASDSWLCTEASSLRTGNQVRTCGIGSGKSEAEARDAAFTQAKTEFDRICSASDDCRGYKVNLEPGRTTCNSTGGQIQCHRLLVFHIQEDKLSKEELAARTPTPAVEMPKGPRIEKGMKKSEILAMLGEPSQVLDAGNNFLIFTYRGQPDFCQHPSLEPCTVTFKNNKVEFYYNFNPHYTDVFDDK